MIYWHRLLGLTLTDFFEGSPWKVELEKDLSKKEQRLDLVILKKDGFVKSPRIIFRIHHGVDSSRFTTIYCSLNL